MHYSCQTQTNHLVLYHNNNNNTNNNTLTLLVGWQEAHLACKKLSLWGAGVVICLERGAVLHMAQLMPLPLTVSCFSEIQIGFTFLVLVHPGSPGKRVVKRVCVYLQSPQNCNPQKEK